MATITKSDELRLYNRSRVLACLRERQPLSRTGIHEATGLSSATVTQVTANLIDDNIIQQTSITTDAAELATTSRRGRPQVLLGLRAQAATTAVVTLLLNHLEVTLFDYCGNQLHQQSRHLITATLSKRTLTDYVKRLLDSLLAENNRWRESLKHITVVYQGTVSSDNTRLLWSPITGVREVTIADTLTRRYEVGVTVLNDCNAIACALYKKQITANQQTNNTNFAAVLLSHGIGLGMYHNGRVLTGSQSSAAEFGHMLVSKDGALCRCGRYGCIEAYASDYAIVRNANRLHEHTPPIDEIPEGAFSLIVEKALQRNGPERKAFAAAGYAIGHGLVNLFMLFDPFPVAVVETTTAAFGLMESSIHDTLQHFGDIDTADLIQLWDKQSEYSLVLEGASTTALEHIDLNLFGFGKPHEKPNLLSAAG